MKNTADLFEIWLERQGDIMPLLFWSLEKHRDDRGREYVIAIGYYPDGDYLNFIETSEIKGVCKEDDDIVLTTIDDEEYSCSLITCMFETMEDSPELLPDYWKLREMYCFRK